MAAKGQRMKDEEQKMKDKQDERRGRRRFFNMEPINHISEGDVYLRLQDKVT